MKGMKRIPRADRLLCAILFYAVRLNVPVLHIVCQEKTKIAVW